MYIKLFRDFIREKIIPRLDSRVIKNIFWLSFDKIFRLVLGMIAGIWVARYLGPGKWGELNYIQAYVSIILVVAILGMDGFLVKEIIEGAEKKRLVLGTAFFMRIGAAILTIGIVYGVLRYLHVGQNGLNMYFFLSLTVLFSPLDVIDIEYQSELKSKRTVLTKSIAFALGAIAKIVLILLKMPLIWFAAVIGFEALLAYLLLLLQYQISGNNLFAWGFRTPIMKGLATRAWPFMMSSLVIMLYMRMDQIMLGTLISEKEVGQFSAAVRISELFLFLPMAIMSSVLPGLLKTRQEFGREKFLEALQRLFNWMFLTSLVLAIGVTLFSGLIVHILYGPQYEEASHILIIHVWSLIPIFLGVTISQYIVIEGITQYSFYRTILGLVVNIVLNIILIPLMHGYGAAVATLISQCAVAFVGSLMFRKTRLLFGMQVKAMIFPVTVFKTVKAKMK